MGSRRVTGGFSAFSNDLVRVQVHAWRRVDERRHADSAKLSPSDWARKNRRSLGDGAEGLNADGIAGASGLVALMLELVAARALLLDPDQKPGSRESGKLQNSGSRRRQMETHP